MSIIKRTTVITLIICTVMAFMPLMNDQSFAATKKPGKATIKLKMKSNKATITYKAKNAKKYKVYQYKGKKWKAIKTGKKKTIVKIKKAGTYKFKVRGLNGKKKGKFSKVVKVKVKIKNGKVTGKISYEKEKKGTTSVNKSSVNKSIKKLIDGAITYDMMSDEDYKKLAFYYGKKAGLSDADARDYSEYALSRKHSIKSFKNLEKDAKNYIPSNKKGGKKNPIRITLKSNIVMRDYAKEEGIISQGETISYVLTPESIKALKSMEKGKFYTINSPIDGRVHTVFCTKTEKNGSVHYRDSNDLGNSYGGIRFDDDGKTLVGYGFETSESDNASGIGHYLNDNSSSSYEVEIQKKGYTAKWSIDGTNPDNVTGKKYEKITGVETKDYFLERPISDIQAYLPIYRWGKAEEVICPKRKETGNKKVLVPVYENGKQVKVYGKYTDTDKNGRLWYNYWNSQEDMDKGVRPNSSTEDPEFRDVGNLKPIQIQGVVKYGDKKAKLFPEHYSYNGYSGMLYWVKVYKGNKVVLEFYANNLRHRM